MRRDPFASGQRASPVSALEYFTNREGYLEAFTRHADKPEDQDLPVLVFYGVGGIGKTTLIRKLCADLAQSPTPLPHARFNLENVGSQAQAYRDVLLHLRADLESEHALKFPRFDLALAVLLASEGGEKPALVKISPGLSEAFGAALELAPGIVKSGLKIAGRQVQSLVARSESLERWVRHVGGTEAVWEMTERLAQDDQIILDELIRRFAQDLGAGLPGRPGKACRAVLCLDTYEALWTGRDSLGAQARLLDAWVRLLAEYLLGAGVLLVIAGRDRIGWGDGDPEWEAYLDQHLLGGVSAPDAQTFLARRGIGPLPPEGPDALQAAILRCADTAVGQDSPQSCHLLALALSADIVLNTHGAGGVPDPSLFHGVPPARAASELAARFLKSLHDRNLELWVEALSLAPRFDEAAALALDAHLQLHAGRAGWEQLRQYSFVTAQPDGFLRMHRTMRALLRARSPRGVAGPIHAWLARYWQERGEGALAFYHQWCQDPEAQVENWVAEHDDALTSSRIPEARALLTRWAEVALDDDDRPLLEDALWARTHLALGRAVQKTPQSPRQARLLRAIQHFRSALSVFTEEGLPERWAETEAALGLAGQDLTLGDRTQSLRDSEAALRAALRVWTEHAHPLRWAETQNSLGVTYAYLPTGDRTQNLQTSIDCFQAALRVWTRDAAPDRWSRSQNNIGCSYILMPTGNRGDFLRRAAACFRAAAEVQPEDDSPQFWARTQHNLGIVYFEMPDGDRDENLQRAVACYQAALRVHTEEELPEAWAETQNSLGKVYCALGDGGAAESLWQAIGCFEASTRVWTPEDNPDRWAQSQTNRGEALAQMPDGDRRANLRAAMACFEAALRIHTEGDYPDHWAKAQKHMGLAWQSLAAETGDSSLRTNADACWASAVRGYRAVGCDRDAEEVEGLREKP